MKEKLEYLLSRANELFARGLRADAVMHLRQAADLNPRDHRAWVNLLMQLPHGSTERLAAAQRVVRTAGHREELAALVKFAKDEIHDAGIDFDDVPSPEEIAATESEVRALPSVQFTVKAHGKSHLVVATNDSGVSLDEALKSISCFVDAATWPDALIELERRPELRSKLVDQLLHWLAEAQDDEGGRQIYQLNLQVLRASERVGDIAAFAEVENIEPGELAVLMRAVRELQPLVIALTELATDAAKRQFLQKNPALYKDAGAEVLLAFTKRKQQNEDGRRMLEWHLWLLFWRRTLGVDKAFVAIQGQQKAVDDALAELASAVKHQDLNALERLIDQCDSKLETRSRISGLLGIVGRDNDRSRTVIRPVERVALLGLAHQARHELGGTYEDLGKALEYLTAASLANNELSASLGFVVSVNLAMLRFRRFETAGDEGDLAQAVRSMQAAESALPRGSDEHVKVGDNLASILLRRYEHRGDVADLEAAVSRYQRGVDAALPTTVDWTTRNSILGLALIRRYDTLGRDSDLQAAIRALRSVVESLAEEAIEYPNAVQTLAMGLVRRFRSLRQSDDIREAIRCHQLAIERSRTPQESAQRHANLCYAYEILYEATQWDDVLHAALAEGAAAIELGDVNQPLRAVWLENHARALMWQYARSGMAGDIDAALEALQKAALQFRHGRSWATCQINIAQAHLLRSEDSRRPGATRRADEATALEFFRSGFSLLSTQSSAPDLVELLPRFGHILCKEGYWVEASQVLASAVASIDFLYEAQLSHASRQSWLERAGDLNTLAAYAFAKAGMLEDALSALEAGRARQLADALALDQRELRSLVDIGRPDLLERYERVCEQLRRIGAIERASPTDLRDGAADFIAKRARQELVQVLEEVRRLPGFESFLTRPTIKQMIGSLGPNVLAYVAYTTFGGFVLHVSSIASQSVSVIWLPDLTTAKVEERTESWRKTYQWWHDSPESTKSATAWHDSLESVACWAWETAGLGTLLASAGQGVESIVLVQTGRLGFLPLHTACTPDASARSGYRYAADSLPIRVVPSWKAYASAARRLHLPCDGALVAEEPGPVNAGRLPAAQFEARAVLDLLPMSKHLRGEDATREHVLDALADFAVGHFCCHAFADQAEPLSGGLLMSDNEVLTLRDVVGIRLQRCRLVVLSACETGIAGDKLPNEAISLAAGFLQAGAAAVISSLWLVDDTFRRPPY